MKPGPFAGTLLLLLIAGAEAQSAETRYVIRAQPVPVTAAKPAGTTPATTLTLNQAVTLEGMPANGLCPISTPLAGTVPCAALGKAPVTLASTEQALQRLVLLYRDSRNGSGKLGSPADREQFYRQLLAQLELRFALSPSLRTALHYAQWLDNQRQAANSYHQLDAVPPPNPVLERMKASLSRDFSATPPLPPVPTTVWLVPRPDMYLSRSARSTPAQPSLFQAEHEVVGWAGGRLVQRMRTQEGSGVAYSATFDGFGVDTLAPLYELAKQMRRKVNVKLSGFSDDMGLSQAAVVHGIGSGTVSADLPAYAITDAGLVEGRLVSMTFDGGACASESHRTSAQFRFPAPLRGTIYGVFASSRPIDVKRAQVKGRSRQWLEFSPGSGHAQSWTDSSHFSVDLNGDGIADLKGGYQSQNEAVPEPIGARLPGLMPVAFRPVAGWYEHAPHTLQGNIAGKWQELARHDVVTCT